MKSFVRLAVVGVSGVALFKLFTTIFIPLLVMMLGIFALTLKIALIVAVGFFIYSLFFKKDAEDEREIVVEAEAEEA
jgi:hypothetical protein